MDVESNKYYVWDYMSEFEEKFGNRFFIIDSKNINEINSKLYGFTIIDNEIVNEDSCIDESSLNGMGAYIYINSSNDSISISQDFNGCWGLYLNQEDDYFALSNSFLKLVEFLKDNHEISFNQNMQMPFYIHIKDDNPYVIRIIAKK